MSLNIVADEGCLLLLKRLKRKVEERAEESKKINHPQSRLDEETENNDEQPFNNEGCVKS